MTANDTDILWITTRYPGAKLSPVFSFHYTSYGHSAVVNNKRIPGLVEIKC